MEYLKLARICKLLPVVLFLYGTAYAQDKVDQIIDTGVQRNEAAKDSQDRVNSIANSTDKLVAKYKRELKVIDGLKVYNDLFRKQIAAQNERKERLKNAIAENAVVERQIFPLMLSMVEALEKYIELDLPFYLEERRERVAELRKIIGDAEIIAAEKLRKVFEAYQIETDFSNNIDAYRQVVTIDGSQQEVNVLRFGRISLVYQSDDGKHNAMWDNGKRDWVPLDAAEYRNHIKKG